MTERYYVIQLYRNSNELLTYQFYWKLPLEEFMEMSPVVNAPGSRINRIVMKMCEHGNGLQQNIMKQTEVLSFRRGQEKVEVLGLVPGLLESCLKREFVKSCNTEKPRESYVGKIVKKKGESDEKLILEQSDLRVYFRDGFSTIDGLKKSYIMKTDTGEWKDINEQ